MAVLENLEPKNVFHFFEQMCEIPHGSGNTKAVSDWLMRFAAEHDLEAYQDDLNNVIIIKPASAGYETAEAVILQGHMDMVCECAPDCTKDMETEGLDLAVDGDYIYAKGTTLGGDDGIAVAMALAVLADENAAHPRVEAIFTVDEETGMTGASGIDVSMIRGRKMINIDSEFEGVFTVSCAGGNRTRTALPVTREPFGGIPMRIVVSGLKGGHSGIEIHKGLANACVELGRVLAACADVSKLRIVRVEGGLKGNAIPYEAEADIVAVDAEQIEAVCAEMEQILKQEYDLIEDSLKISVKAVDTGDIPMDELSTERVLAFLNTAPNGVMAMSAAIPGLVQTSLNLGILTSSVSSVNAEFCLRSSFDSQKQLMVNKLKHLMNVLGGTAEVSGDYAGWAYRVDSPLRDLAVEVFTEQYGHPPIIEAIHAGVECGIFAGKLPGLDCISYGPNLLEIHTCRERMEISSVQRCYRMLLEMLKRLN